MNKEYFLGLDIGSISVKFVLISPEKEIIKTDYCRSKGDPLGTTLKILEGLKDAPAPFKIGVTGSGGRLITQLLSGKYYNEIIAQTKAVGLYYPNVKTVIEMGGEDSKLLFFEKDITGKTILKDFSINMICAAGTGSFLDQQANRLGLSIENEFGNMALKSQLPPRIAGRCSVFAKSDMIHLQQIGTPVYDIVAGLCYAVARSFIGGVGRGKEFLKPVLFAGGVAANLGLVRAFEYLLNLKQGELIIPKYHALMGAIGAANLASNEETEMLSLITPLRAAELIEKYLQGPKINQKSWEKLQYIRNGIADSINKISDLKVNRPKIQNAYLGIDIGSLSTNIAIIDQNKNVLARRYLRTAGKPIEVVISGLKNVGEEIANQVNIIGVGVTGSGRYMIGDMVGADLVKNEITAQATAAIHFVPEVDTIFEIGGQDSKYIRIKDKAIIDFEMNKVCAAGTGSFLEEQAEKLGISIENEFAHLAFNADGPSRLGDRCTVFIESDLVSYQQKGAGKEDLVAGLAYSIGYNYLNRVVGDRPVGKHILFQGGVAYNHAVVSAFEKILGKKIIVPPHHDITGAIGVAILAMNKQAQKQTTFFKGFDLSKNLYQVSTFECKKCDNVCNISRVKFGIDAPHFYGSRCEIFEVNHKKSHDHLPDLFKIRRDLLLSGLEPNEPVLTFENKTRKKRVGIPLVLQFYDLLPYWKTFFEELGFEVVISGDKTTPEIIQESVQAVKAETCFPIKIAHGHILKLIDKRIDFLFLPSIINMEKSGYNYEQNYNCPLVQAIPYIIKSAIDLKKSKVEILAPAIFFQYGPKSVEKTLMKLSKQLNKNGSEIKKAITAAEKAQNNFLNELKVKGQEIIKNLRKAELAIVLIGHAYNSCDPGVNFNLAYRLRELGVQVIPIDFLPLQSVDLSSQYPNMYWRSGQKMLNAVKIVKDNPQLQAVYISNFHCGPDSFIAYFIAEQMQGKPYLQLELDEHSADAGIITRCEAFLDSLENIKKYADTTNQLTLPLTDYKKTGDKSLQKNAKSFSFKDRTIYLPFMCDHTHAIGASFRACGIMSEVLPESDSKTMELGKKHASGKECLPFIITLGDFLKKITEQDFNPQKSAFFMPQTSGPCRFGQYNRLHQVILEELGYGDIEVISPGTQDSYTDFGDVGKKFRRICWQGIVAVDFLEKLARKCRPYEINKGETDLLFQKSLDEIVETIEKKYRKLPALMREIKKQFESMTMDQSIQKPVIGVVGEIFIRANRFSNSNLIRKIEKFGGEVRVAPLNEWISYTTYCYKNSCLDTKNILGYVKGVIQEKIQRKDEHVFQKIFDKDKIKFSAEPSIEEILKNSKSYIDKSFEGEAILSIGKGVDYIKTGLNGIINVMPFTCMPGVTVTAISKKFQEENRQIPWLNMVYDSQEDNNFETRLEAFIYQAKEYNTKKKGGEKSGFID